jgi:hypothetical protein
MTDGKSLLSLHILRLRLHTGAGELLGIDLTDFTNHMSAN